MAKPTALIIKAVLALTRLLDCDFVQRLYKVYEGLLNNPAYPRLPVDLAAFKTAIDSYSESVTAALDGGKIAITLRNKRRADVALMYHILGHYVEGACNYNMNTFVSSGFIPAPPAQRAPAQPVAIPKIVSVKQGGTGQLIVTIGKVDKARSYEIRCVAGPGGTNDPLIVSTATVRPPTAINNLTPGTIYTFQARAFGKQGFSDWSDPANRMCI